VSVVDGHCHVSPIWYEPVETLLRQMDANGVEQAVLVQLLGQYHNDYQLQCLRRYPDRFACVVAVDVDRPQACTELRELAAAGAAGVRLRPNARSPGGDPLAIWRTAEAEGLAVSCAGTSDEFAKPAFAAVVAALPRLTIVLEHLAGASRPDADQHEADMRERAFGLARHPNVHVKVPGLGEILHRARALPAAGAPFASQPLALYAALQRFGADRLMWGSDFPVVAAREGYTNALRWTRAALAEQSPDALHRIFAANARRVWRLPRTAS
jgi:L-fuconolactonase